MQPSGPCRLGRRPPRRSAVLPYPQLQEMGCNSIRTSHNPPTPELLDACDQLGMLVFDETRMMSSNPEGLGQFENYASRSQSPQRIHVVHGQRRRPGELRPGVDYPDCYEGRRAEASMARVLCPSRRRARSEPVGSLWGCGRLQLHGPEAEGFTRRIPTSR